MPMIDVTAVAGTFSDKPELIKTTSASRCRLRSAFSIATRSWEWSKR